jgi:hypothetical protein
MMIKRPISRLQVIALVLSAGLVSAACSGGAGTDERRPAEAAGAAPSFVNRVWRVSKSSGVAPGTLYVFLSEGTLLITSPNSKPALGSWKYEGGALVMVEESIPYKTDIVGLSAGELRLRSHNPGGSVEITLVPAEVAPPPR